MTTKRIPIRKIVLSCLCALAVGVPQGYSQNKPTVIVPKYDDQYSHFVKQLESGQTDINYQDFRESLLESAQFQSIGAQKPDLDTLRNKMRELMQKTEYPELITVAKKMLSIDYTDMEAHKVLQQTYKALGDSSNRTKYHDIEFGLLNSIVKKGDGKSCQTAWPVIQIAEEYFILNMLGAKILKQSIDNSGGTCDKMQVKTDEGEKIYYFEISNVFKGYHKQGIN